ncbi:MAG: immune inhibitor A [Bacteroidetes bacterium]|nr:immune inhibitor A [Bacteroidota bacterium]
MKKVFVLIILFAVSFANAQNLKYQKVQITGTKSLAKTLLQLGVTIDHADVQDNSIITEISEDEVKVLQLNNINYKVLIADLSKFYEQRNAAEALGKTAVAPGVCNAQNIVKPTYFHLGSMGGFFTWNEMKQILDSMALLYPNLITVKQALNPLSIEGRELWMVKISDNPNIDEAEPEVLYNSLHHAREAAGLSQLIFYMWYLLQNYATDPDIQATINSTELYFVPCVNPDGYVYNQTINPSGGGMWRKNRRLNSDNTFGVDLNRNYGNNWGFDNVGSSPTMGNDTYRGTAGFSEPETQAMRDFCNARQFVSALNAHTYSNLLIYPWGYLPSLYTPDSATFVNWSVLLTEDSRFLYGTGDQTVNYVVNGDSDDWMYGEQSSKPKILSMTPEAGSANDGFWPVSSRILDICKTTFKQNYYLAKLSGSFARVEDTHDKFLSANGYLKYSIQRLGNSGGSFTVSITPLGSGISSTGAAKIYSLAINQQMNDSIAFTLNSSLTPAQPVKYLINVNNGFYIHSDTITKIYGTPITLFYNDGSSISPNFIATGSWGISTTKFVSPPGSITDSPSGLYANNENKTITLSNAVNLSNAMYAHLQYYTRFELEKNYDNTEILYSTNNGSTWSPLCGRYETSPASSGASQPVYDGLQDAWVKEDIDITAYSGLNFLVRFKFFSDGFTAKDGFYFDDLRIRKITGAPNSVNSIISSEFNLVISPNPSEGLFTIKNPDEKEINLEVYNIIGQQVIPSSAGKNQTLEIDLRNEAAGLYFVKIKTGLSEFVKKVVVEK